MTGVQTCALPISPNNLTEAPEFQLDFLRNIPTTWDETRYVDGFPGKYSIIARRSGQKWYVAGVNAEKEAKNITIKLPMFSNQKVSMYNDKNDGTTYLETVTIPANGELSVTIQPNGGFIVTR